MPWLGMAATLGWNYAQHRAGRSTMCGLTRRVLPPWGAVIVVAGGAGILLKHLLDGYPPPPH